MVFSARVIRKIMLFGFVPCYDSLEKIGPFTHNYNGLLQEEKLWMFGISFHKHSIFPV